MAINCCICKKKHSGWIIDYALSPSLNEHRVCSKCWEQFQRIKNAKLFEDVPDDVNYISFAIENNELDQKVKDFLLLYLDGNFNELTAKEIDDILIQEHINELQQIMVTSGFNFDGFKIEEYLGYISGETVIGMGLLKALAADFSNLTGTESAELTKKTGETREKSMMSLQMVQL